MESGRGGENLCGICSLVLAGGASCEFVNQSIVSVALVVAVMELSALSVPTMVIV
jgi:hypothetical protein